MQIGNEGYFLSAEGFLMPAKKGQAPPDLRYFNRTAEVAAAGKMWTPRRNAGMTAGRRRWPSSEPSHVKDALHFTPCPWGEGWEDVLGRCNPGTP